MMRALIFLELVLPAAAAVAAGVPGAKKAAKWLTLGVPLLCVAAAGTLIAFPAEAALSGGVFGTRFTSGGLHGLLLLLCDFVFFCAALTVRASLTGDPRPGRFCTLFLLSLALANGAFLAGDLAALCLFAAGFALSLCALLYHGETERAKKSGNLLLAFVLGGCAAMFFGLIDLFARFGSLDFAVLSAGLPQDGRVLFDGLCILAGLAALAGLYPLHVWLPGAYASANATVLPLFGLLGAAGVTGILLLCRGLFAGNTAFALVLFCMGAASVLLGSVFALLTPDLMRALAFVSIAQTGALTIGIAVACGVPGAELCAEGAALHVVTLSLGMGLLLISAGVFLRERGEGGLNALRGAGRGNIPLTVFFALGALSLSFVPLSGGYLSFAMMLKGALDGAAGAAGAAAFIAQAARWLMVGAGAFTFAAMTKLFLWLFVDPPIGETEPRVCCGKRAVLSLALAALPLLAIGFAPQTLADKIASLAGTSLGAGGTNMVFFTAELLKNAMLTAVIGSALYVAVGWWALTNRQGYFHTMRGGLSLERYAFRPVLKALVFGGTLTLRFLYSIPEWFVALCEYVLNFGTQPRTEPGRDDHFALYSKKYVRVNPIRQMLAYELLLFGLGVVIALLYLLMG